MDGMDGVAAGGIMGHASIPGAQANQGQTSTMSPFHDQLAAAGTYDSPTAARASVLTRTL